MVPLTSIWERYFLRQMIQTFVLFLIGFYGIYVLIDYSNHAASFKHYHFTFIDVVRFYGYEFAARATVLVPFAILIACVRTLCSLNTNNELVALMASGIRLKRLLRPFIAFGLFFTLLMYLNTQIFEPLAAKQNTKLEQARSKAKQKKYFPVQHMTLEDRSSLIFQSFDDPTQAFFDAYWVRSIDDIYRVRHLFPNESPPRGEFVEHLQRNAKGAILLTETLPSRTFPEMHFNQEQLIESIVSPETQSLSVLWNNRPKNTTKLNEKEAFLLTTFYYKLAMPWLCLLAVIAPTPFCIRFSRTLPIFFIYALSIFGLVAFYLVMDAASVLGERQALSPAAAIWVPFFFFLTIFGYRFIKKT